MEKSYTLSELQNTAEWVLEHSASRILLFYGEMGSGKTIVDFHV